MVTLDYLSGSLPNLRRETTGSHRDKTPTFSATGDVQGGDQQVPVDHIMELKQFHDALGRGVI